MGSGALVLVWSHPSAYASSEYIGVVTVHQCWQGIPPSHGRMMLLSFAVHRNCGQAVEINNRKRAGFRRAAQLPTSHSD